MSLDGRSVSGRRRSLLRSQDGHDQISFTRSLSVGRHPDNVLVLGDPEVSNRHAVIESGPDVWFVRDLGSRNGTSVNHRRINGRKEIEEGSLIRFGGVSSWIVERLVAVPDDVGGYAFVENTHSGRRVRLTRDRLVIGTEGPADMLVPEWLEGERTPLRVVIFEEFGELWAEPAEGLPGLQIDGEVWSGAEPMRLHRERVLTLGDTSLRMVPDLRIDPTTSTTDGMRLSKRYDLELYLVHDDRDRGTIRVEQNGKVWQTRTSHRFFLLYLLAQACGSWVRDEELRSKIWGGVRAREIGAGALNKLVYDTRQMFLAQGIDGWFIEKHRGATRLRVPAGQVHIESRL